MNQLERHSLKLALLIVLIAGLVVRLSFLDEKEYRSDVDEGNYHLQARLVADNGTDGFRKIADSWIAAPKLHETPNPLRVVNTLFTAAFITVDDSYHSLSYLCLLCYMGLLIATFFFVRRYWGWQVALITVVLLAFSPVQMAMARRALMDVPAMATASFAFFAFWRMDETGRPLQIGIFVVLMAVAILVKETACLMMPFFGLVLLWKKYKNETAVSWPAVFLSMGLPVVLVLITYLTILGYGRVAAIIYIIRQPTPYGQLWANGPWYRYVVDYLSLSPLVTMLAIGFVGYTIGRTDAPKRTIMMVLFLVFLLFMYAWLPKNIRYALLFDLPLCFFAASMLVAVTDKWPEQQKALLLTVLLLVGYNGYSFYKYFVDKNIYDPLSYSLLVANRIIPDYRDVSPETTYEVKQTVNDVEKLTSLSPTPENFSNLALTYYNTGKYKECIETYRKMLKLNPNDAVTYNNICSAYNAMKDWPNAIAACNEAIRIDSSLARAKNNLKWAQDQQAKGVK